jgi:hypothetical protein
VQHCLVLRDRELENPILRTIRSSQSQLSTQLNRVLLPSTRLVLLLYVFSPGHAPRRVIGAAHDPSRGGLARHRMEQIGTAGSVIEEEDRVRARAALASCTCMHASLMR